MENQLSLDVYGHPVDMKSRQEDVVSGWAILIFTPLCSLRSTKVSTKEQREQLARTVIASCNADYDNQDLVATVAQNIEALTVGQDE